jgi:hypothetical protein
MCRFTHRPTIIKRHPSQNFLFIINNQTKPVHFAIPKNSDLQFFPRLDNNTPTVKLSHTIYFTLIPVVAVLFPLYEGRFGVEIDGAQKWERQLSVFHQVDDYVG